MTLKGFIKINIVASSYIFIPLFICFWNSKNPWANDGFLALQILAGYWMLSIVSLALYHVFTMKNDAPPAPPESRRHKPQKKDAASLAPSESRCQNPQRNVWEGEGRSIWNALGLNKWTTG